MSQTQNEREMNHLQIAYVLCTEQLDYCHTLAASAALTRTAVPACKMVCVMDPKTFKLAKSGGIRLRDWVDQVVVVNTPHRTPEMNSRYLKTTLRSHLSGDFLYLDVDAVIVDPRFFLSDLDCECMAASQNRDHIDHVGIFPDHIGRRIYNPLGWNYPFLPYVNTGVTYCRDNARCHALYSRWHELWNEQVKRIGLHLDQPALNRALWESSSSLKLMAPEFNSPVDVGPEFETGAWIYHYYISCYSGVPKAESLLGIASRIIRRRGRINPGLLRWMLKQKKAFLKIPDRILPAIRQGLWVHAFHLFQDLLRNTTRLALKGTRLAAIPVAESEP
jgi:hypothetical protein